MSFSYLSSVSRHGDPSHLGESMMSPVRYAGEKEGAEFVIASPVRYVPIDKGSRQPARCSESHFLLLSCHCETRTHSGTGPTRAVGDTADNLCLSRTREKPSGFASCLLLSFRHAAGECRYH